MKQHQIYNALSDCCSWNNNKEVKNILKSNPGLDVLHSNGLYFHLAIRHGNVEMLNTLLEYYTDSIKDEPHSLGYNIKVYALKKVLEDAEESFPVSEDIQAVLDLYIGQDEGSVTDEEAPPDFFEEYVLGNTKYDVEPNSMLTEENLAKLGDSVEDDLQLTGAASKLVEAS